MMAAREGEQYGLLEYACVKRIPRAASLSRLGDSWKVLP
jgi:hypothetical protein